MNKCSECKTENPPRIHGVGPEIGGRDVEDIELRWFLVDEINMDPTQLVIDERGEMEPVFFVGLINAPIPKDHIIMCLDCFDKKFNSDGNKDEDII